jgi:hypothetical protein
MLNKLGTEKKIVLPAPVTLPRIILQPDDDQEIEREAREAAARVAMIRQGLDAWRAVGKANSFEGWKRIGAALHIGKLHALKVTGANAAWGSAYSRVFSDWMRQHHFNNMPKSVRSVAVELHENIDAITAWRESLPEKQRRRLIHPLSITRRWRAAIQHNGKAPQDYKREATAAWRRFVSCVESLPREQGLPFWQIALDQAAARIAP